MVAAELQHGERRRVLSFSSLPRRVKEAIVRITGEGSYGILRTESGVHVGVGTACNLARSARSRDRILRQDTDLYGNRCGAAGG